MPLLCSFLTDNSHDENVCFVGYVCTLSAATLVLDEEWHDHKTLQKPFPLDGLAVAAPHSETTIVAWFYRQAWMPFLFVKPSLGVLHDCQRSSFVTH